MKKLFFILIAIGISQLATAEEPAQVQAKSFKKDEMNGYKLSDFPDFFKKWKLVTVRFRKDTGEMRWTYANDIAYKALKKGITDYPEGAVFGKVGIKTSEDPAFPSSAVPGDTRRYQFMVRNKKKFKDTEGWGYVLFDKAGTIFPEDPAVQTAACAACHRIIPERGYVFSQLMTMDVAKGAEKPAKKEQHFTEKFKFKEMNRSELPDLIKKEVPEKFAKVQVVDHEISKFLFQGTLDEIKPLLSAQALSNKMPALIISSDQKSFSLVFIENQDIMCEQQGKKGYFMKAVSGSPAQGQVNYENRFCWTH